VIFLLRFDPTLFIGSFSHPLDQAPVPGSRLLGLKRRIPQFGGGYGAEGSKTFPGFPFLRDQVSGAVPLNEIRLCPILLIHPHCSEIPEAIFCRGAPFFERPVPCRGTSVTAHRVVAHRYQMLEPWNPERSLQPVRATDSLGNAEVALSFLPGDLGARHEWVRRDILEQGDRLRRNPHPLLLNVLDVVQEGDLLFLVEERPRGGTLLSRIREGRNGGEPLPLAQALGLSWLLCRAAEFVQPFSVNGFFNPQEVFLEPWEGGPLPWYPKVAHPGVRACLRFSSAAFLGLEEEACLYAAPEFVGRQEITEATDFYGIGALLYSMLTLRPPTGCFLRPAGLHPGFPQALEASMLRALEEDPRQRRSSPGAFRRALREHAGSDVPWGEIEAAENRLVVWTGTARTGTEVLAPRRDRSGPVPPRRSPRAGPAQSRVAVLCLLLLSLVLLGLGFRELSQARLHGENRLQEFRRWEILFRGNDAFPIPLTEP